MAQPPPDARPGGGPPAIAIAAVLGLLSGGALGIAIGAMLDDFVLGLTIGGGFGLSAALAVGWFVMRDRRPTN